MKVLVLAPPMENFGGIQRYTATMVRALRELLTERDVCLLAIRTDPKPRLGGQERLNPGVKWRFLAQALREAKRRRPDLVICAHVGLATVGWLLRFFLRRPYWVVAHGVEVWAPLPLCKRLALAQADRLLAVSDFTRRQLVKRYRIPAERVFPLPPTFGNHRATETSLRAALPIENGRRIVLTVSRLAAAERYKGHDVMLRAWGRVREKVPGAVYVVVGDGDDRPRLEALARQLGLGDSVCFAGAVSEDVLAACYEACEVFAMPARTVLDLRAPQGEGFGIVFLEAMAHGKPVVAPRFGAPSEFVRHAEHGLLVDPEDPASVAQALIDLLTSPERAGRMGRAAREWVSRHYSYNCFCERLRQILNELA